MDLDKIDSIYFIGIGGIGMSGLARYFHLNGKKISGYDKTPSALTDELIQEGISVHFEEDIDLIPKDANLIIYTPAITSDHEELAYYREHHYHVIKRADLLQELTKNSFTIAIAGTHGKTTTTTMIAHILKSSGYDCTAFLGGIAVNYNSNFLAGKNKTIVVEADEFDRSFLKLCPDIAVITSCDPDHLDIYGSKDEVVRAYGEFATLVKPAGFLITKRNLPFLKFMDSTATIFYYSNEPGVVQRSAKNEDRSADYYSVNGRIEEGTYIFDFKSASAEITNIHLAIAGRHNVENAIAAIAVALQLKIPVEEIRQALNTFQGVIRRFQFIITEGKTIFIDDYAHHPEEIKAILKSVREIFTSEKITCIFQPHLFTRTLDFADDFGEALSLADEVILLPIYAAREFPIDGVSSDMLLDKISAGSKIVCEKQNLLNELRKRNLEVVITLGAGDIDQMIPDIKNYLQQGAAQQP
ncbi:MAG: UDP-N-acetylmuramate--L-alanine ligase [Chitinophagales bacterium]|nr:UDP-N-acetylmuramate--L-alanine ligase [Chitinophagales bacterium]